MSAKCKFVEPDKFVMAGWGCCQCKTYNGLQRKDCKRCGHKPCVELPLPEKYDLCNECGVPQGMAHVGHAPKEESMDTDTITQDRFASWSEKLLESKATPMLVIGMGHDDHNGEVVIVTCADVKNETIRAALLFAARAIQ